MDSAGATQAKAVDTARPEIRIADPRCDILPRLSALLAGTCLLLHIGLVLAAGPGMLPMSLPMLGLAALCGGCAGSAWRRRCSDRELGLAVLLAGAMVSLHLVLTSGHAGEVICGSTGGSAMGSMLETSGMIGAAIGVPAVVGLLMHLGVALAGIAGLIAMAALAHRRLAPGQA